MKKLKKVVLGFVLSFVVVLSISVYSFIKLDVSRKRNAESNQTISALQNKKNNLENDIDKMKSDEYLDEQAREELGMLKDGETIYDYSGM